ncbi:MAG: hypothetical protein IJZ46_04550 [Bacilli bacterium]|nr:hypothetical protein [Bacilli bacterium]
MQDLNELKLSINKLINNIDEEKRLKKELEEKEKNYSICIDEISKLENEINKLSSNMHNKIQEIYDSFNIFTVIAGQSGFVYAVYDIIIEHSFSITSFIPITIGIVLAITTNIVGRKIVKKKINSTEYTEMQREKEEKEINLANKKIERKTLSEEITKLKSQLDTNNYNTNESIDILNVELEDNIEIITPLEETNQEEKIKPKTRVLIPNKK